MIRNREIPSILKMTPRAADMEGKVFSKALYSNVRLLEKHYKALQQKYQPSDEYKAIEAQILEYQKERSDKNPDGTPKMKELVQPDGSKTVSYLVTIDSNRKLVTEFIQKLKEKYADIFAEQEEKEAAYQKELDYFCGLKFVIVKEKDFPKNLTPAVMFSFDWMLDTSWDVG